MNKVVWTAKALKQLAKTSAQIKKRLPLAAGLLANWPDVANVKALKGRDGYRLRVGDYRLIFTVNPVNAGITIIRIEEVKKRDEHTYRS